MSSDVAADNPRAAVLDAEEQLRVALEDGDAASTRWAEDLLTYACERFGYADVETCLSIARNEKWVAIGTRGCVITAGRAWGCEPGAFTGASAAQQ